MGADYVTNIVFKIRKLNFFLKSAQNQTRFLFASCGQFLQKKKKKLSLKKKRENKKRVAFPLEQSHFTIFCAAQVRKSLSNLLSIRERKTLVFVGDTCGIDY